MNTLVKINLLQSIYSARRIILYQSIRTLMHQNKKAVKIQHSPQNDYKLVHRENSQSSQKLSLTKFLKRKPDPKKIIGHPSCKKKRQSNNSDYFVINNELQDESSSIHAFSAKQISSLINKDSNISEQKHHNQKALQTTRSENFISAISDRQVQQAQAEGSCKMSKTSLFSKQSQTSEYILQQSQKIVKKRQNRHFNPYERINSKKSKTEYFDANQLKCQQQESNILFNGQQLKLSLIKDEGVRRQYQKLLTQLQSFDRKNKLLQEDLELYTQRNYLLQTEKKHIEQMLKEKDKIIDRLQRQKSIFKTKGGDNDKQVKKYKEQISSIKDKLQKQQQKAIDLKQQNQSLIHEIDLKNDQLIIVYDQYTDLQAKYKKEHQQMNSQRQRMKAQIQNIRQQIKKQQIVDCNLLQIDKWKQTLFKQKEEIKYLQIQNQCLMISKEQLCRSQAEIRKLRDERDYFKKKIMESIRKNNRKHIKDFSRSENSLTILQLSEMSS